MIKTKIKASLILILLTISSPLARAQGTDVELSRPVGSDILPGGSLVDTDIKTSFIFAKLIPFVIKWGIRLAVAAAVFALIVGGFQMMLSYGNTEKRQKAMKTIMWALIGLFIAMTALGIVTMITNISFV